MNWKGLGKGVAIIILIILITLLCHYALTAIPVCGYLELIDADIPKECEKAPDDKKKTKVENPVVPNPEGHNTLHPGHQNVPETGGSDVTYDAPGGLTYFTCEHALRTSRPDEDDYPGDCPWPLKGLNEQTGGLNHDGKQWIEKQTATPGMAVGAAPEKKLDIIKNCCPDREIPFCKGAKIGTYGIVNKKCDQVLISNFGLGGAKANGGGIYSDHNDDLVSRPASSGVSHGNIALKDSQQGHIYRQCNRGSSTDTDANLGAGKGAGNWCYSTN